MTEKSLRFLEEVFAKEESKQEGLLVEKQVEITKMFDDVLADSGQVGFSFSELLEVYREEESSFTDIVLDILDSMDRQGEDDWVTADAILVGAIELGGTVGLF